MPQTQLILRTTTSAAQPLLRCWLAVLGITLAWEASGWDLGLMRLVGQSDGFAWQSHWFLSNWLHVGMRQASGVVLLFTLAWAVWPQRWQFRPNSLWVPRPERLAVLAIIGLCLLAISLAKRASLTSCPWDLQEFGGAAHYVQHWNLWQSDGGPGHCFPGGHVSSAFSFLALGLPWLCPLTPRSTQPRLGWSLIARLTAIGLLLGTVQTMRGAHYPSHTLWTLLICASLSLAVWQTLSLRAAQTAQAALQRP